MASIGLKLAKNFKLLTNLSSMCLKTTERTLFDKSALGFDGFKKLQDFYELSTASTVDEFKKRIAATLAEDKAIMTDDVKTLLYLTKTDADAELFVNVLKRYNQKLTLGADYKFGAPTLRLLYLMNKTDEMVKMQADPEFAFLFKDQATYILILNKLVEDKRYADCLKVFFDAANNRKFPINPADQKLRISNDIIMLAAEALYHLNNPETIEMTKKLIEICKAEDKNLPYIAVVNLVILAINQNQLEMAHELTSQLNDKNRYFQGNAKAITFSHLGRFGEAITEIEKVLESKDLMGNPNTIFPLTIRTLREKTEVSEDKTYKDKVEELSQKLISTNRLSQKDLLELTLQVRTVRMGMFKPPGGIGGNLSRQADRFNNNNTNNKFVYNNNNSNDSGFNNNRGPRQFNQEDGGFNRGPRQFNQEGGGFNRGPRQFNQEDGGFNRGPRQFNQEGGGFNRGPRQFNQEGGGGGGFNRAPRQFNQQDGGYNRGPRQFNQEGDGGFNRAPPRTERRSQPPRKFDDEDD